MSRKTIHIQVQEDGSVKTDFVHFTGTDCLMAGRQMHVLLAQFGVQIEQTDFTPKPELFGVQPDVTLNRDVHQEIQGEG